MPWEANRGKRICSNCYRCCHCSNIIVKESKVRNHHIDCKLNHDVRFKPAESNYEPFEVIEKMRSSY